MNEIKKSVLKMLIEKKLPMKVSFWHPQEMEANL